MHYLGIKRYKVSMENCLTLFWIFYAILIYILILVLKEMTQVRANLDLKFSPVTKNFAEHTVTHTEQGLHIMIKMVTFYHIFIEINKKKDKTLSSTYLSAQKLLLKCTNNS